MRVCWLSRSNFCITVLCIYGSSFVQVVVDFLCCVASRNPPSQFYNSNFYTEAQRLQASDATTSSGRPFSGRDVSQKAPAPVLQEPSFDSLLVYFKAVQPPLSVERLSGELQTLGIRQLVFKTIALSARGCIIILLVDPTAETIAEFSSCWRASAALAPYPIYKTTQRHKSCAMRRHFSHD